MNEKSDSIETQRRPFFSRCLVTTRRNVSIVERFASTRAWSGSAGERARQLGAQARAPGKGEEGGRTLLCAACDLDGRLLDVEQRVEVEELVVEL